MFFARIRRRAAWASLAAGIAFVLPAGQANAGLHGQPTAVTITPEFADTVKSGTTDASSLEGLTQVAQVRNRRRIARQRANARQMRNTARRQANRRANRRVNRQVRNCVRRGTCGRGYVGPRHRYYGNRIYRGGRWWYWNDGYYYDNGGALITLGLLGLAAGALAGSAAASGGGTTVVVPGAVPAPYTAEWYRRCDLKYRSFRASDGTYLGYDGIRHTCRLP